MPFKVRSLLHCSHQHRTAQEVRPPHRQPASKGSTHVTPCQTPTYKQLTTLLVREAVRSKLLTGMDGPTYLLSSFRGEDVVKLKLLNTHRGRPVHLASM
jgi:hypothetical protein